MLVGKFTKRQDVQGAIAAKFKDLVEPDDFAGLCRPFLSQGSVCLHILAAGNPALIFVRARPPTTPLFRSFRIPPSNSIHLS